MEVGALPGMTDFQPRWDWFPRAQRDPRLNPSVNCFTHTYFDSALAAARESEVRWMRSAARALEGIPTSVKDEDAIAG
jgi:aspartyl-tRNA(Asn)/glutamyl-tRNA(Gln) amidotransferase subunit A